jgi:hypothetical protein
VEKLTYATTAGLPAGLVRKLRLGEGESENAQRSFACPASKVIY